MQAKSHLFTEFKIFIKSVKFCKTNSGPEIHDIYHFIPKTNEETVSVERTLLFPIYSSSSLLKRTYEKYLQLLVNRAVAISALLTENYPLIF